MLSRWQERAWRVGIGLTAVIVIAALLWTIPKIERDLETKTERALEEIDRDDLRIRMHGRDATIVGPADASAVEESAIQLVSNVEGVASVRTEFVDPTAISLVPVATTIDPLRADSEVADASDSAKDTTARPTTTVAEPATRSPALRIMAQIGERSVVLTGAVASEDERRLLVETVGLRDDGPRIVDGLQVAENVPAGIQTEEMTSYAVLINQLAEEVIRGTAHLRDGEIALSGIVPDPRARERLEETIATMRTAGIDVTGRFGVNQEPRAGEDPTLTPKEAAAKSDIDEILNNDAIEFESGGSRLVDEQSPALDAIAVVIKRHPGLFIQIDGHTDNRGDPDKNRQLSQERADTVRDYLVERGVDPFVLAAIGYGDQVPVADNDSDAGRRRNRRVEFTITEVS